MTNLLREDEFGVCRNPHQDLVEDQASGLVIANHPSSQQQGDELLEHRPVRELG